VPQRGFSLASWQTENACTNPKDQNEIVPPVEVYSKRIPAQRENGVLGRMDRRGDRVQGHGTVAVLTV
jgi:hypothetical protein